MFLMINSNLLLYTLGTRNSKLAAQSKNFQSKNLRGLGQKYNIKVIPPKSPLVKSISSSFSRDFTPPYL